FAPVPPPSRCPCLPSRPRFRSRRRRRGRAARPPAPVVRPVPAPAGRRAAPPPRHPPAQLRGVAAVSFIVTPGVYELPADVYHRDPVEGGSLTSSGARRLLEMPPARWRHEQEHRPAPTPAMILGTAVHSMTLGVGEKVVKVDAD